MCAPADRMQGIPVLFRIHARSFFFSIKTVVASVEESDLEVFISLRSQTFKHGERHCKQTRDLNTSISFNVKEALQLLPL